MRTYNKNMHQKLCVLQIEYARKTSCTDWFFVAESMTAKKIEKKFGKMVPDDAEEETRARERGNHRPGAEGDSPAHPGGTGAL